MPIAQDYFIIFGIEQAVGLCIATISKEMDNALKSTKA
jgi:hypothetical protein